MKEMFFWIKMFFGIVASLVEYLIGGYDMLLYGLLSVMCLDFISGIIAAAVFSKNLNSEVFYKGGAKKLLILVMVAVSNLIDLTLNLKMGIRSVTIGYYFANECLSIFENSVKMGLPVPKSVKDVMEQIKNKDK